MIIKENRYVGRNKSEGLQVTNILGSNYFQDKKQCRESTVKLQEEHPAGSVFGIGIPMIPGCFDYADKCSIHDGLGVLSKIIKQFGKILLVKHDNVNHENRLFPPVAKRMLLPSLMTETCTQLRVLL